MASKTQDLDPYFRCEICFDSLSAGNPVYHAPRRGNHCGHTFHEICLTQWLDRKNTCPSCRQEAQKTDFVANDAILEQAKLYEQNPKVYILDEKDLIPEDYRNIPIGGQPLSFYERFIEPLSIRRLSNQLFQSINLREMQEILAVVYALSLWAVSFWCLGEIEVLMIASIIVALNIESSAILLPCIYRAAIFTAITVMGWTPVFFLLDD